MSKYLVLSGVDGGLLRRVVGVEFHAEDPVLERSGVKVDEARVNGEARGNLAVSAMLGGNVALDLAFDELGWNQPLARLSVEVESPDRTVAGRSGDLLFALATFLRLGEAVGRTDLPSQDFVATGMLDPLGNVAAVDHVPEKIKAALAADLPEGSLFFYPQANDAALDEALRSDCDAKGLLLCPVDRLADALDRLGVKIEGPWTRGSPFLALDPYSYDFRRVFFGREREVASIVTQLDTRAELGRPGALIIGASGAGKSSICMAGVIPALMKRDPGLSFAVWRPRDAASGTEGDVTGEAELVRSITASWRKRDDSQTGLLMDDDKADPLSLSELVEQLAPSGHRRIFLVDQFEGLFALGFADEAQLALAHFLQRLQEKGVWVLGTLRSEFYRPYSELTPLFEMFGDQAHFTLRQMNKDALRQVIVRPAELAGLRYEQGRDGVPPLDDRLLADAQATEDPLPLLSFVLHELYERIEVLRTSDVPGAETPRTLTYAAYNSLGGLKGALGQQAAKAYEALSKAAQAELPGLLSVLAVPSFEDARETSRPAPLEQWSQGTPGRELIDALIKIRVLITDTGANATPLIRVAHEALFTHWELATQLLNASRQSRLLIEDFRQKAKLWENQNKPRDVLLSSPRDIENARSVRKLISSTDSNRPVIAYIDRSIALKRRNRLALVSTIIALLALSLIQTGNATWANNKLAANNDELSRTNIVLKNAFNQLAISRDIQKSAKDAAVSALAAANRASTAERAATQLAIAAASAEQQQRLLAESQTREVRRQRSLAIAQFAEQAIDNGDAMTGVLLARSQLQSGDEANWTGAAESALRRGLMSNRERLLLKGHFSFVTRAAFSPDGQQIVTASGDGTARVWTLDGDRANLIHPVVHEDIVTHAAFSPDGQRIVTASSDDTARVWTVDKEGVTSILLKGHTGGVTSAEFSPDGRRVVTASDDGTARVWTLVKNSATVILLQAHDDRVYHAEFSPDGKRIVTASEDGTARVWTVDGERVTSILLKGHTDGVTRAEFSPNGQRIVTASADGTARVWTVDGDRVASILLKGHTEVVTSAEFSPDGQRVVTASDDRTARVWTLDADPANSILLKGHSGAVYHAEFSPDGQRIVTASTDLTARVWRLDGDGTTSMLLKGHSGAVNHAAFSPDGRRIITSSMDGTARVWTLDGDRVTLIPLASYNNEVSHATFSPDGQRAITSSWDGTARVWTVDGDRATSIPLEGHTSAVIHAVFSPDGKRFVTASADSTARVWTVDGEHVTSFLLEGVGAVAYHAAFSPDGRRIVIASSFDGTVIVFTFNEAIWTRIVLNYQSFHGLTHTAFSPDGQRFVTTASGDQTARLWTLADDRVTSILLEGHNDDVTHAEFSSDGQRIVTASDDGTARIWTLEGDHVTSILLKGHAGTVTHAAFSMDGKRVVTASDDNTARVWTLDGDRVTSIVLKGHVNNVTHAAFSRDGKRVVTASDDGTARVWTVDKNRATSIRLGDDNSFIRHAGFSMDEQRIVTASRAGDVRVWEFPTVSELMVQSDSLITRCLTLEQIEQFGLDVSAMGNGRPPCRRR